MIPRLRRLAATAIGGALLTLPALTGAAMAAPSDVLTVDMAKTEAQMKAVAEYWKPDRLKRAESSAPATPGSRPSPEPSTSAGSQNVSLAVPRTSAREVAPALPKGGSEARTFGKVFFRFGDKEYWCSATSVAAKNRSVVATAAHCAYDVRQLKPADYWIFVPNPGPDGSTPDGIYVGASLSIHQDWSGAADYDYDYAFVTVHEGIKWELKGGQLTMTPKGRLQDNVGGQGISVLKRSANSVHAFGYPAGPQPDGSRPFDGRKLAQCAGRTSWVKAPGLALQYGLQVPKCDFTAGASGGPWLLGYDAAKKLGRLNGVNSLTWNRDAKGSYDAVSSPYFNADTFLIYQYAAGSDAR
ncbi:trypsin-like serine peptidase [Thermoactinospora rubra]|uniref:trypsin-like serine peptidase n=1 Tax=Thermoactinospora rubra TaxID=1088767 RepID=UPI000A0FE67D|nr:hypothetical protein [Thermoactinospora rubra]